MTWKKPTRSKSMNLARMEIEMESESMSGCVPFFLALFFEKLFLRVSLASFFGRPGPLRDSRLVGRDSAAAGALFFEPPPPPPSASRLSMPSSQASCSSIVIGASASASGSNSSSISHEIDSEMLPSASAVLPSQESGTVSATSRWVSRQLRSMVALPSS